MYLIFVILVILLLTIIISNYLINRQRRENYIKAGKKWDGIVRELRRRK